MRGDCTTAHEDCQVLRDGGERRQQEQRDSGRLGLLGVQSIFTMLQALNSTPGADIPEAL